MTYGMRVPREDKVYAFNTGKQPHVLFLAVAGRRIQISPHFSTANPQSATAPQHAIPQLASPRLCALMASSAEGDPSPQSPPPPRGWLSGLVSGAGRLLAAVLDPESSASDTTSPSSPESSQSPQRRALAAAGTRSTLSPPRRKFQMPREMLAP